MIILIVNLLSIEVYAASPKSTDIGTKVVGPYNYNISYERDTLPPSVWAIKSTTIPYHVINNLGKTYYFYPISISGGNSFALIGIYEYDAPQDTDLLAAYLMVSAILSDFGFEESSMSKTTIDGVPIVIVTGINKNKEEGFGAAYWLDNHTNIQITGYSLEHNGESFIKSLHIKKNESEKA